MSGEEESIRTAAVSSRPPVAEAGEPHRAAVGLVVPVAAPPAGALAPAALPRVRVVHQLEPSLDHFTHRSGRRGAWRADHPLLVHAEHRRHHHLLALRLARLGARAAVRQHVRPLATVSIAPTQFPGRWPGNVFAAVVEEGDVGVGLRELQPGARVVDGEVHVEARAPAGRGLVGVGVGVGDGDGVRVVLDVPHSIAVGLDGEDQRGRGVGLADEAETRVAAVGRRGVEQPERVPDHLVAAGGVAAWRREGVGYGEEERDGEEDGEKQGSHRARGVNGKRRERPGGWLCWFARRRRESQVRELG